MGFRSIRSARVFCQCRENYGEYAFLNMATVNINYFLSFDYLFLAVLGLPCCTQAFSSCGEWGLFSCCGSSSRGRWGELIQACGILLDQGANPCPLNWQARSSALAPPRNLNIPELQTTYVYNENIKQSHYFRRMLQLNTGALTGKFYQTVKA